MRRIGDVGRVQAANAVKVGVEGCPARDECGDVERGHFGGGCGDGRRGSEGSYRSADGVMFHVVFPNVSIGKCTSKKASI